MGGPPLTFLLNEFRNGSDGLGRQGRDAGTSLSSGVQQN